MIDGKPALSAALMAALVRRAGHSLRKDDDDDGVTATIVRSDDPGFTYSARWDRARADQAGLGGKDNYVHHPTPMYTARAITEVARRACQDVIYGLHSPEELGAEVTVNDQGELVAVAGESPTAGGPASSRRLHEAMVPRDLDTSTDPDASGSATAGLTDPNDRGRAGLTDPNDRGDGVTPSTRRPGSSLGSPSCAANSRVRNSGASGTDADALERGGSIDVFLTHALAKKRADYIQAIKAGGGFLGTEYGYISGVLIRVTGTSFPRRQSSTSLP